MGLNILILAGACVVSLAYAAVVIMRRGKTPARILQQKTPAGNGDVADGSVSSVIDGALIIEHVPVTLDKFEQGIGFVAADSVKYELVETGKKVLELLPPDIRACLSCPVAGNLTALVLRNDNRNDLIPERVIAAVAVAEASLALSDLMAGFVKKPKKHHQIVFNECLGRLTAGKLKAPVHFIIMRISKGASIPFGVATEIWECVVQILREGKVSIPGLRVDNDVLIVPNIDVTGTD